MPDIHLPALKIAVKYFVLAKVLFMLAGLVSWWMLPLALDEPALVNVNSGLFMAFHWRWDAIHYYSIATQGYNPEGLTAFFPLFPLCVYLLAWVLGGFNAPAPVAIDQAEQAPLLAGLIVANLAFLLFLYLFYLLAFSDTNEPATAERAVKYAAFFPLAFYYHMPYTESLFMLGLVAMFYLARRDKILCAGLCAALVTATRPTGLVMLPVFALECYMYLQRNGWHSKLLIAPFLPTLGIGLYMLYSWHTFNDALMFIHAQQQSDWARSTVMPWTALRAGLTYAFDPALSAAPDMYARGVLHASIVTGTLIITLLNLAWKPARGWRLSYIVLSLGILFLILTSPFPDERVMHGLGRYTMVIFPLYITLARWTSSHAWLDALITYSFIGLYSLLSALYVGWYPVA